MDIDSLPGIRNINKYPVLDQWTTCNFMPGSNFCYGRTTKVPWRRSHPLLTSPVVWTAFLRICIAAFIQTRYSWLETKHKITREVIHLAIQLWQQAAAVPNGEPMTPDNFAPLKHVEIPVGGRRSCFSRNQWRSKRAEIPWGKSSAYN